MVVAVTIVLVVEMTVDQVVYVVAMGDGFVPTARAMDMVRGMARARVAAGAGSRVGGGDLDHVLVIVTLMGVVEMAVVEVIHMAFMQHGGMAAAGAVLMGMIGMNVMSHDLLTFLDETGCDFSVAWARALKIKPETCWSAREYKMCLPCRRRVSKFSARRTRRRWLMVESSSPVTAAISETQASPWLSMARVRKRG
jgi:hypothetical protein